MPLTPLQVQDVCHAAAGANNPWGWGNTQVCRFLHYEMVGKKFVSTCIKQVPKLVAVKKQQVGDAQWKAMGDNCPGFRYMKHKDQGYDVP